MSIKTHQKAASATVILPPKLQNFPATRFFVFHDGIKNSSQNEDFLKGYVMNFVKIIQNKDFKQPLS